MIAKEFLKFWVERDVVGVIEKQIELNRFIAWTRQQRSIERVSFRSDQPFCGSACGVLPFGRFWREKITQRDAISFVRLLPIFLDRVPARTEALEVGVAILRDDRRDPLGVLKCESKTNGRAVIEDVESETLKPDYIRETIDDVGQAVE